MGWKVVCIAVATAVVAMMSAGCGSSSSEAAVRIHGISYVAVTHTIVNGNKATEYAAGNNSDSLLGNGTIAFAIQAPLGEPTVIHFVANPVTLYTAAGTLTGTAQATVHISVSGHVALSNGHLSLTKGTGDQVGHSIAATFTGTGKAFSARDTFQYTGVYH
jgi:hypothetical protein